ncbi:MAG: lysostaphin resistance A-like protein [Promethearchaeota archaeon]
MLSTFLFSWILWIPSVLENFGIIRFSSDEISNSIYFITIIIGAFGPTFGAFIALRNENLSFKKHLKKIFSRKGINKWSLYLIIIILIPLMINGFSLLIGMLFGLNIPLSPLPHDEWFYPYLLYFPYLLFVSILGGGQEEIGWRGYLQGELLKKYSPGTVSLIIGFFWGIWHTPLWFMIWDSHKITPYIGFIIMTMSISFVFSYIYQNSKGNLLIMILFHGSNNAAHSIFYLFYDNKPATEQYLYWIYVAMNVVAAIISYLLLKRNSGNQDKNELTVVLLEKKTE